MAIIIGLRGGHALLTGTSGDDTIVAHGGYNTINGGGGNDLIYGGTQDASIVIGALDDGLTSLSDTVVLAGASNMLFAGDENVTVTGNIHDSTISLGNGQDSAAIDGTGNTLLLGAGHDTVSALGGYNTIDFVPYRTGPNEVQPSSLTIYGPDDVLISGQHNTVQTNFYYKVTTGITNVTGGSGYGTFNVLAGSVVTSGEYNTIGVGDLYTGGAQTIVAGSGHDTVSAAGSDVSVIIAGRQNSVSVSESGGLIQGGSGDGVFDLSGQYFGGGSTGAANALETGGIRNDVTLFSGKFDINPGSGADTVSALLASGTVTFSGAADRLIVQDLNALTAVDNGRGLVVDVQVSNANSLTIDHLDGTGLIDFSPAVGFTSVQQVLADLKETSAGTYTLSLPGQGGSITFLDPVHLTANSFKIG